MTNQESDLIHMGSHEDSRSAGTNFGRDKVAETVHPHFIHQRHQRVANDLTDLSL